MDNQSNQPSLLDEVPKSPVIEKTQNFFNGLDLPKLNQRLFLTDIVFVVMYLASTQVIDGAYTMSPPEAVLTLFGLTLGGLGAAANCLQERRAGMEKKEIEG